MHPTYNMMSMLPDLPHLWSHLHFESPYIFYNQPSTSMSFFHWTFINIVLFFFYHPLLSYMWAQSFTFSKLLVFSLTLCCVVFFTCVCVSFCNVLFKLQCVFQIHPCLHMFLWHCDVIDVATKFFMFWTFKCYCDNLTRGDEKSCKDKLLLHHNCFYYSCNGPYNLAMLVTMLLKLLLASWICCCCFNYAFNFNLFQFGVTQPLQYVPTFAFI